MLRFKILATTIPVALAGFLARGDLVPSARPCISIGEATLQIATAPWQPQAHVSFTGDPALATVRVQVVDSAEAADFAVVDDVDTAEPGACSASVTTRFIGIADTPTASDPVIYLSDHGNADYRVFVKSRSFTARDAAALIVGARGSAHARVATAAL
jgi:hypothetical protein